MSIIKTSCLFLFILDILLRVFIRLDILTLDVTYNYTLLQGYFNELRPIQLKLLHSLLISILIFLIYMLSSFYKQKFSGAISVLKILSISLLINFVERITLGSVSDYISFSLGNRYFSFNIADFVQIVIAVKLCVFISMNSKRIIEFVEKRKQVIVDPDTQFRFVFIQMIVAIMNVLLISVCMYSVVDKKYLFSSGLLVTGLFTNFLFQLKMSNLVSGPVYAYKRFMGGNSKEFKLREGDFHKVLEK